MGREVTITDRQNRDLYGAGGFAMTMGVGTAVDASGSQPALGGLNLLGTQPAGARLGYWFAQNQSAATIMVALDDGAGGPVSLFALDPAAAAGRQGGSMGWQDTGPHVGRIRIYGAAGSQYGLRVS